jgi:hypothetical protein
MRTFAAALMLLAGWPCAALAQKAELPVARVGDQWQFAAYLEVPSATPNRAWVIKSATAEGFEGTENGEPLKLTRELNVLDSPRHAETNPRLLSFPLEIGKRWRYASEWLFKFKGSRGTIDVEVVVEAHERVQVPAGTFEAFKLISKANLGGASPSNSFYGGVITTTYWYAPAVRAIVKSATHNPYQGRSAFELVSYSLQP